jgi:hypothetical protein
MDWGSFFLTLLIGSLFGYAMGVGPTLAGSMCILIAALLAWPLGWWVDFVDHKRERGSVVSSPQDT